MADNKDELLLQMVKQLLGTAVEPQNRELGEFVRRYAGSPDVADLEMRYSFRDDVTIRELIHLLEKYPSDDIRLVDACCGMGVLAARLKNDMHIGPHTGRIRYIAVDQDSGCVDHVEGLAAVRAAYRTFDVIQRRVWDLSDHSRGTVDLIVLCNALHEIAPWRYPSMFDAFNILLQPDRGSVCVVDMAELPSKDPEAVAMNWNGTEVKQFLEAGGLTAVVTTHEKSVPVFQAHIQHTSAGVNQVGMLTVLRTLCLDKQARLVPLMTRFRNKLAMGENCFREWMVATGTIARITEELQAIDQEIARLTPSHQ
jgi:hypothetical protein